MDLPSFPLQLALLLLLPLLCFFLLRQDPKKQPRAHGLKCYPLISIIPDFIKNQHRFLDWSTDVVKRDPGHTMSFKAFGLTGGAITANPANVEYIVKTNFANYPKGELAVSMLEDFLGHGIFNSDGEQWLWQRKAASHEFSRRSLRSFVVDAVRFEELISSFHGVVDEHEHLVASYDMVERINRFGMCDIGKSDIRHRKKPRNIGYYYKLTCCIWFL